MPTPQLHFIIRVPKPGPAVPLSATDLVVHGFSIIALTANLGNVYTGGFDVTAANPGETLRAGDREPFPPKKGIYNLRYQYIDVDNNNEGVVVKYWPFTS